MGLTLYPGGREELLDEAEQLLDDYLLENDPAARDKLLRLDERLARKGSLASVRSQEKDS